MIIQANELLAEVDYRYGPSRAIWSKGGQLKIKNTDGNLDLSGAQINYLPRGLTVGGSLDLTGTQITSLPKGLKVGRHLYLWGTQVASLPDDLQVGGNLYLYGVLITEAPKHLAGRCFW